MIGNENGGAVMRREDLATFYPYFSADEPWGDIATLQWSVVHALYLLRRELAEAGYDWGIIIHDATGPGHSPTGYHPKGLAVDFHFATPGVLLHQQAAVLEIMLQALRLSPFCGIGVYPEWNWPGFHLDLRGSSAKWGQVGGKYVSWNFALKGKAAGVPA